VIRVTPSSSPLLLTSFLFLRASDERRCGDGDGRWSMVVLLTPNGTMASALDPSFYKGKIYGYAASASNYYKPLFRSGRWDTEAAKTVVDPTGGVTEDLFTSETLDINIKRCPRHASHYVDVHVVKMESWIVMTFFCCHFHWTHSRFSFFSTYRTA